MIRLLLIATAALLFVPAAAPASSPDVSCEITFDMEGWSFFYRTATGEGVISCNNGQRADVKLEARGGGLTFGKRRISDAKGKFSEVRDISELFGSYAQAEAHAGAVKSSTAQVVTKGEVSLAIAGTGQGIDVGVAFGKLTIQPAAGAE